MMIRLYPTDKAFKTNIQALRDLSLAYGKPKPCIVIVLDGKAIDTDSVRMLPGDTFCYTGKPYGENRVDLSRIDQVYFWFVYNEEH